MKRVLLKREMRYVTLYLSRVLLILAVFSINPVRAASVDAETVRSIKPGQRIEVVLQNGDRLIGKLGAISQDYFVLGPDRPRQPSRELRYSEVQQIRTKMTRANKWAIAGAVYVGLTIIGFIVGG